MPFLLLDEYDEAAVDLLLVPITEPPLEELGLILGASGGGGPTAAAGEVDSSKVDLDEELLEAFLIFRCLP